MTRKAANQSLVEVAGERRRQHRAVTLIYCSLHLGGPHAGVSLGPAAMKVARLVSRIEKIGYKVQREVEIAVPEVLTWWEKSGSAQQQGNGRYVDEIAAVSLSVARAVEEALAAGTIAITLGGDHSLAIGSIAGASSYYRSRQEEFGLLWFDAHGDINTPDTSPSGNVHGMPLAVSLGKGHSSLVNLCEFAPKIKANRCSLIGIRDLDQEETRLVQDSGILPYTMRDVDDYGIKKIIGQSLKSVGPDIAGLHVSFDLDVIDPDVAPGVSTDSRGGLTYRESHYALELLADSNLVRSIDIVELNPTLDIRNRTAELAVELVQSALGKNIL